MNASLSAEPVKNAAEIVNSLLAAKGYTKTPLLFPSVDWPDLIADQPQSEPLANLEPHGAVVNNDRNIINSIYALCSAIDRHNAQHKAFNHTLQKKEATIADLERKLQAAEDRNERNEDKLEKAVQLDQTVLLAKIKRLEATGKTQSLELARARHWNNELQTRFNAERRKNALELDSMRVKLLESRNLSLTTVLGKPVLDDRNPTRKPEVNGNVIHHNKATVAGTFEIPAAEISAVVTAEYEGLATQLSEVIENLIHENGRFARFVFELNHYFAKLNSSISSLNLKFLKSDQIPSPSDLIDIEVPPVGGAENIEPFEASCRPLLSSMYKNYHCITALVDLMVAHLNGDSAASDTEQRKTIESLTEENRVLFENWQKAIQGLEQHSKKTG